MEEIQPVPGTAAVDFAPDTGGTGAGTMSGQLQPVRFVRLTAWSLIVGPLTLAVAGLVHPSVAGEDAGTIAAAIGPQGAAWQAWAALLLLGCLASIPGALRLMRTVGPRRGARLTTIGTVLVVVAATGVGGFSVLNSIMVTMVDSGSAPDPAVLEAITRSESDPLAGVVVLLFFAGVHLGWPLLLGGATRAGLASHWQWLLASAGSVAVFSLSGITLLAEFVGVLAIAIATAPTARLLLTRGSRGGWTRPSPGVVALSRKGQ